MILIDFATIIVSRMLNRLAGYLPASCGHHTKRQMSRSTSSSITSSKECFTACHPMLTVEARIALTLRLIGGLTTAENRTLTVEIIDSKGVGTVIQLWKKGREQSLSGSELRELSDS